MRILLLLAGLFAALFIARQLWRPPPPKARREVGRMVRCDYCGLHIPEEEAVYQGNRPFCSQEHRRLAARLEHDRH